MSIGMGGQFMLFNLTAPTHTHPFQGLEPAQQDEGVDDLLIRRAAKIQSQAKNEERDRSMAIHGG